MNWLSFEQRQEIAQKASAHNDEERCGFVLLNGQVVEVENQAEDKVANFRISPHDYARWEESVGIKGVWHSHLELDGFSQLDQQVLSRDILPWAVYCLRTGTFHQCEPEAAAPLIGRPFVFGVYDCYSLITDKLKELGVELPAWPRGEWGEWNTPGFFPFDQQADGVGRPVTNGIYQEGDILLMNLGDYAGHSDHVGVFVDHQRFLHHPAEHLSRIDRFGSWWERRTRLVLRPAALWKS